MNVISSIGSESLGGLQTFGPLLGGFGIVIWLAWRLFWKVDRRSQLEIALKDKKIKDLESDIEIERTKRYEAENRRAHAEAIEISLKTTIEGLTEQVARLTLEIQSLRNTRS